MKTKINLQDLSLSNFDQVMQVDEVKGGRRRRSYSSVSISSFSLSSFSAPSFTTWKKRRR